MEPRAAAQLLDDLRKAPEQANRAVLIQAVQALAAGDFAALGGYLTGDVSLIIRGVPVLAGSWTGKADVLQAVERNFKKVDIQSPTLLGMIAEGDKVAVLLSEKGVLRETAAPYQYQCAQWFTFRDGKIARIDEVICDEV